MDPTASTICEAFQRTVRDRGPEVALRGFTGEIPMTWEQYGRRVDLVAAGLSALGVGRGDTVALLLGNRMEVHLVDMAALHLGAIGFSVYQTSAPGQIRDLLDNADCRVVVTEARYLSAARAGCDLYDRVEHLICVDTVTEPGVLSLAEVIEGGRAIDVADVWKSVQPDDVATLIYTSGTTGPPKGAQWSHHNVMMSARRLCAAIPVSRQMTVSFLPMAHAAARMAGYYMSVITGAATTFCPDYQQMARCVADAHPDGTFFAVPRVYEKLRIAVQDRVRELDAPDQAAVAEAMAIGIDRSRRLSRGEPGSLEGQRLAAYEKGRAVLRDRVLHPLGLDRLDMAVMAGAPVPIDLVEYFHGIGLPLLEAYGLTECGTFAAFNLLDDFRLGTAGRALPETEIRLADDGEILIRSQSNMIGYRKQPDATAAAIDEQGWLRTGDLGRLDAEGYLSIVDRKKELIISSSGKNMSPVNIERTIALASPFIGQVVAIGDGRHYNVALVTLETEELGRLRHQLGLGPEVSEAALPGDDRVIALIAAAIDEGNRQLSRVEQVKRFHLVGCSWTPDSDELTPTAKLKRRVIATKYRDVIDELYTDRLIPGPAVSRAVTR